MDEREQSGGLDRLLRELARLGREQSRLVGVRQVTVLDYQLPDEVRPR